MGDGDEDVATVSSGGVITGVKTGTTTVTATTEDGKLRSVYDRSCKKS